MAGLYLKRHPLQDGLVHMRMIRLEVEAER
jgi:hypothetical protein